MKIEVTEQRMEIDGNCFLCGRRIWYTDLTMQEYSMLVQQSLNNSIRCPDRQGCQAGNESKPGETK